MGVGLGYLKAGLGFLEGLGFIPCWLRPAHCSLRGSVAVVSLGLVVGILRAFRVGLGFI